MRIVFTPEEFSKMLENASIEIDSDKKDYPIIMGKNLTKDELIEKISRKSIKYGQRGAPKEEPEKKQRGRKFRVYTPEIYQRIQEFKKQGLNSQEVADQVWAELDLVNKCWAPREISSE